MTTVNLPPPTPIGWSPEHTHTGRLGHPRPPRDGWRPCPHCWQQGRIHYDGTWRVCPWCLGVREVHK